MGGGGGGKVYAPPPDYGAMAAASRRASELGHQLGMNQLNFAQQQYNEFAPYLKEIANSQVGMQNEMLAQARDYYDYQKNTFRPVEQSIVDDAMRFSTEAHREEQARYAAADVAKADAAQKASSARAMASMGVNPNSGRFAAINKAGDLAAAAGRAQAMTGAREKAMAMGHAAKMDAAGMGRGLSGASLASYGAAMQAGNSAAGNYTAPGQQYLAAMQGAHGTIMHGQGLNLQGQSAILGAQSSAYGNALGYNRSMAQLGAQSSAGWGQLAGTVIGAVGATAPYWGPLLFASSKSFKNKIGNVDAKKVSKQIEGLQIDRYRYKPGVADEGEHTGPYSEDMEKLGAGAMGGKAIDIISAIGVTMAGVKGLSERLSAIEKGLDAKRPKIANRGRKGVTIEAEEAA